MNRVVVITGASRGLGLCLAENFLEEGDRVYGITKTTRHWKNARMRLRHSGQLNLRKIDLTSEPRVRDVIRQIFQREKRIDVVINNAGYGGRLCRVENLSSREFARIMESNLSTAFLISKYAVPVFRRQGRGLILHISSMAGQRAVPLLFAYSAAKFGIRALSQCVAKENRDRRVKSVTVCPGGMNTGMRASLFGKRDAQQQQSPEFVAGVISDIVRGKICVESGGDIVIRHGKITAIHSAPPA